MDPVSNFLVAWKIPVGLWGKAFFTVLTDNFNTIFRERFKMTPSEYRKATR